MMGVFDMSLPCLGGCGKKMPPESSTCPICEAISRVVLWRSSGYAKARAKQFADNLKTRPPGTREQLEAAYRLGASKEVLLGIFKGTE